jgi:hypothetical protein
VKTKCFEGINVKLKGKKSIFRTADMTFYDRCVVGQILCETFTKFYYKVTVTHRRKYILYTQTYV